MSDPFRQFMSTWAPSVGIEEAFRCWRLKDDEQRAAYVMPDIEPFRDTSGQYITGRSAWREHLKRTGTIELGHADLKTQAERHLVRQQAHRDRMEQATSAARPMPIPQTAAPVAPSQTAARVAERLHGRPTPDRPTLIKIAMEERMRGRK